MERMGFSPSRGLFYSLDHELAYGDAWPEDVYPVTSEVHEQFTSTGHPHGKVLGSRHGAPAWVKAPEDHPTAWIPRRDPDAPPPAQDERDARLANLEAMVAELMKGTN